MSETVYIDLLICVNLIINYFILYASIKYIKINVSTFKTVISAFIGSLFSLSILLPSENFFVGFIIKAASVLSMTFIMLGKSSYKIYIKLSMTVMLITFVMCGIFSAIYFSSSKGIIYTNNGSVYFDISAEFLIITSILVYCVFRLIILFTGKYKSDSLYVFIEFKLLDKNYKLLSKIDTGNSLTEPFSQSPVIVINSNKIDTNLIDERTIRLVPYKTISEDGILKAFKAKELRINKKPVICEVYIAYSDKVLKNSNIEALLSPDILEFCTDKIIIGENDNGKNIFNVKSVND